jgi:hypothetical protein
MEARPILFSGEMVRAILDGRKTQTRRICRTHHKHAPIEYVGGHGGEEDADNYGYEDRYGDFYTLGAKSREYRVPCTYGGIGCFMWVRETFCPVNDVEYGDAKWIDYRATPRFSSDALKWKPSIYMPRSASRITLEIINIKVERLRDISEEDAIAEGFPAGEAGINCTCPRSWFENLWQSINGKAEGKRWGDNPWVWVIEFKPSLVNIDEYMEAKTKEGA